jgi:hypothetical protein
LVEASIAATLQTQGHQGATIRSGVPAHHHRSAAVRDRLVNPEGREDAHLRLVALSTEETMNEPMMQFFKWEHLPEKLQNVSRPFQAIAMQMLELPNNPERKEMFRKLLEAKDCAVRAKLYVASLEEQIGDLI